MTVLSETAASESVLDSLQRSAGVENWRVDLDAHFVTLLRGWQESRGTCGAARLPVCGDDADCYTADHGYSAVSVGDSCSVYALAHHIGHNLGAAHEPADGQQGTYAYAHTHVTAGGQATVMASQLDPSAVVARFSSPALD